MSRRLDQAGLYVRTLVHLRPAQVAHRVRLRGQRALIGRTPASMLDRATGLRPPCPGWPQSFAPLDAAIAEGFPSPGDNALGRFRFLEDTRELGDPADWVQAGASHLWRYQLHYFEWAWAFAAHADREWARPAFSRLWESWRAGTVLGRGVAWSPYVASMRSWVWCGVHGTLVAGTPSEDIWVRSLTQHAAFLRRHLELDVGGNHLIKNLKALIGLGVFLGDERMVAGAAARLESQLTVQVLTDGGHYERSPSYHAQVLGDLLDVEQLLGAAGRDLIPGLDEAVGSMRQWLGSIVMPDGDVPLFNDCILLGRDRVGALGAAPPARRSVTVLEPSGYVVARGGDRIHLIADVGPPCPPDLPAHAHADCLSFELAVDGKRVIVDTGTSTYAAGPRRAFERSTAAHNTVEVDGADQTEVWGVFRAARRAQPRLEGPLTASHDGYERLPGQPRHKRTWQLSEREVEVIDVVTGSGKHRVASRLHIGPGVPVEAQPDGTVTAGPLRITVEGQGVTVAVEPAELSTGFGRVERGHVVVARTEGFAPIELRTMLLLTSSLTAP